MIWADKDGSQFASELSFKISEAIAEKGKPFSDGQFIKHCLIIL